MDVPIEVAAGESLFEAALRQGLDWPTMCKGQALCGLCWCSVQEGASHLSAMENTERKRLEAVDRIADPRIRLACQLRVHGPVTVSRRSVRRTPARP